MGNREHNILNRLEINLCIPHPGGGAGQESRFCEFRKSGTTKQSLSTGTVAA